MDQRRDRRDERSQYSRSSRCRLESRNYRETQVPTGHSSMRYCNGPRPERHDRRPELQYVRTRVDMISTRGYRGERHQYQTNNHRGNNQHYRGRSPRSFSTERNNSYYPNSRLENRTNHQPRGYARRDCRPRGNGGRYRSESRSRDDPTIGGYSRGRQYQLGRQVSSSPSNSSRNSSYPPQQAPSATTNTTVPGSPEEMSAIDLLCGIGVCRTELILQTLRSFPDCYYFRTEEKRFSRNQVNATGMRHILNKINLRNPASTLYKKCLTNLQSFSGSNRFYKHALDHGGFPEELEELQSIAIKMRFIELQSNPELKKCPLLKQAVDAAMAGREEGGVDEAEATDVEEN